MSTRMYPEAEMAIKKQLAEGSPNEFDKTVSGLRLRPLQFLLKMNSVAERSHHSSVGEWATAQWAFSKWKKYKYLWFKPFDWMTDCIGITKFRDIDLIPTHQCQRWKMDMLRYNFTAIHRPENMLFVCNLLSWYNLHASKLREAEKNKVKARDTRIENGHVAIHFHGYPSA